MSLVNYDLQQSPQTSMQTGEPIDRFESAQGLKEVTGALVPLENSFMQGYEQQKKRDAQKEDETRLNEYRDRAYKIISEHGRKGEPSVAELQDDLNALKNEYYDVAANKLFAVDKDMGITPIKPWYLQAQEINEKEAGELTAETNKAFYDLGVDYVGIDKASTMTPDALIQQGKMVAVDSEALNSAAEILINPNSSDTVRAASLETIANIATDTVREAVNIKLNANKMITQVDLDKAKEDLVIALKDKGLTPTQQIWVANRAVLPFKPLADLKNATLEDQKKLDEQANTIRKLRLDSKLMEATNVTHEWFKGLSENAWLLSPTQRETLQKAAQGAMADFEGNKEIINSLSDGDPLNLSKFGENLDKVLKDPIFTDRQKAIVLNAGTQALSISEVLPPRINMDMSLLEMASVIKEDADNAVDNFNWLNGKYLSNAGVTIDTLNKSDVREKVGTKNDYTSSTLGAINKKLLQAFTDTRGSLEYTNGSFKSSEATDAPLMKELNDIVSSAILVDTAAGHLLLDREALDRGIQTTIKNYKLDKPNNLRGDQKTALLFMPVLASGQASRTARQQAVLGNRIEEEPWLKTFQAGLTGAELGGATGAMVGEGVGAVPGVVLGGATGLAIGAYENFPAVKRVVKKAEEALPESVTLPEEAMRKAAEGLVRRIIEPSEEQEEVKETDTLLEDFKRDIKLEEGHTFSPKNGAIGYGFDFAGLNSMSDEVKARLEEIAPGITTGEIKHLGMGTADRVLNVLAKEAEVEAKTFAEASWDALNNQQKRAVMSMAYNMGIDSLSTYKKFKAALLKGDYEKASDEVINSKRGRGLDKEGNFKEGLVKRSIRDANKIAGRNKYVYNSRTKKAERKD